MNNNRGSNEQKKHTSEKSHVLAQTQRTGTHMPSQMEMPLWLLKCEA